jgi:hypothetical protein
LKDLHKRYVKVEKEKSAEEAKSAPVREKLKKLKKSKEASMEKTREILSTIRECVSSAHTKSVKIESIDEVPKCTRVSSFLGAERHN